MHTGTMPLIQKKWPLILRYHRLLDAFTRSDDERDFYVDRCEGFIVYVDLDKSTPEIEALEEELEKNPRRYCLVPKMSFYEIKKFMESFITEKVYDVDAKERLLELTQGKDARGAFSDFLCDHLAEYEKWVVYHKERFMLKIVEWLCANDFFFVFEEESGQPKVMLERLKKHFFDQKPPKDVQLSFEALVRKASLYHSKEMLNPKPKRGRPPKQLPRVELEPQVAGDLYVTVPASLRAFLFLGDIGTPISFGRFAAKDGIDEDSRPKLSGKDDGEVNEELRALSNKLEALRARASIHIGDLADPVVLPCGKYQQTASTNRAVEESYHIKDNSTKKHVTDVAAHALPRRRPKGTEEDGGYADFTVSPMMGSTDQEGRSEE